MSTANKSHERRALILSAFGALIMAALGFGFALLTRSEALMLDGLFSLLGFVMTLGAIRISRLVYEPGNMQFQFGFAGFEPLFNLIKGLVIIFISLLAAYSSIVAIQAGGREIEIGWALVYASIVTIGSIIVFLLLSRAAKKTASPLLQVDAKNWMIDGAITAAVLVGFLVIYFVRDTQWSWIVPYADPMVVLVLVVISLPIPFIIIKSSVKELLLGAPDLKLQQSLREKMLPVLQGKGYLKGGTRLAKTGRMIYLYVFILLDETQADPSVIEQDAVRHKLTSELKTLYMDIEVDIFFTRDNSGGGLNVEFVPFSDA
jgi:cation diffusion facilitator family transporter